MTASTFTLPTLEDELAELRAVGVDIDAATFTPGEDDAAVNYLLRILAAIDLEDARLARAEARAVELAHATYARQRTPLAERRASIEAIAMGIAARTAFGGKRKSRELVYGSYGRRASAETVKIVDQDAAITWCERNDLGDLVTTETKVVKKLPHGSAKEALLSFIRATGELPAGVELVPAKDEPFVKVAPEVLAAERGEAEEAR